MSIISSTTGHNRKQEEKIAGRLYFFIGLAVAIGIMIYFFVGTQKSFDPFQSDETRQLSPDSPPGNRGAPAEAPKDPGVPPQ